MNIKDENQTTRQQILSETLSVTYDPVGNTLGQIDENQNSQGNLLTKDKIGNSSSTELSIGL